MKFTEKLTDLWNWLPAFRAVAETEHYPTASQILHVSASALSRTIGLLEYEIGQPLFDRVGRRIVLNSAGQTLLVAVRDSMRMLDEGLASLEGAQFVGPIRLSVAGPFASTFVLPALGALSTKHPRLLPHITSGGAAKTNDMLLRGQIDVAVLDDVVPNNLLTMRTLCTVTHGVYCGPGHPLFADRCPSPEAIVAHVFAAPVADAQGKTPDAWPPHITRTIAVRVVQMQVAIDLCLRGEVLVAIPDLVAQSAGLRQLPLAGLVPTTLVAVHRPSLPVHGKTEALVDELVKHTATLRSS